jgi:hypothetical protein
MEEGLPDLIGFLLWDYCPFVHSRHLVGSPKQNIYGQCHRLGEDADGLFNPSATTA